jgi:hypothetical protein
VLKIFFFKRICVENIDEEEQKEKDEYLERLK